MSDANGFGWVEVKDGLVIAYTGNSNNPTVHKFENEKIVAAVELQKLIKDAIDKKHGTWYNNGCRNLLRSLIEESEKDD